MSRTPDKIKPKPKAKAKRAAARPANNAATPQAQLTGFIAKYSPQVAALGKACVARMRKRLPGAQVLVYDNYNALAVGFGPNERASDAVFSIAFYPQHVNLCFLQGGKAKLKDPKKLLQGSGKLNRFIPIKDAATLDDPAVRDLIDQAEAASAVPYPQDVKGRIVIKSIAEKQRPRRPK
ncbi:MAG: DUF1801 domain-containing protein [Phycisphaerales bacterium]|nr:DUF1801 domain-containing protein [Phycisphaerales bacterium]